MLNSHSERPASCRPFYWDKRRHIHATATPPRQPQPKAQQTVDGSQRTLEIASRSSYVPSAPIGVRSRFPEDTRPNAGRTTPLELPIWMK
jgi:hypothetical protein